MGYRSDVILAVDKKLMGKFMAHVSQEGGAKNLCFANADEVIENYKESGNFLFRWESIKWYEGYPEVDCLTEFMDECDDLVIDEFTVPSPAGGEDHKRTCIGSEYYRFVRVGEDTDDIVQRGEGFEIYTRTEIDY
tara:strand:- start:131 stop:535 length:405 start_codon:yes stop_codon:yes gene_type:complete